MLFRFFVYLCCILATIPSLNAGNIVATVDEEDIITQSDLQQRIRLVSVIENVSTQDQASIRKIALEGLIDDILMFREAKRYNIAVSSQQVEEYIAQWEKSSGFPPGYLPYIMHEHNISKKHFHDRIRSEIIKRYIIAEISGHIRVSNNEIENLLLHTSGLKVHAKVLAAKKNDPKTHKQMLILQKTLTGSVIAPAQYEKFATLEEIHTEYNKLPKYLSNIIDNLGNRKKSEVLQVGGQDYIVLLYDTVNENAGDIKYRNASNILGNHKLQTQVQKYLNKLRSSVHIDIIN